MIDKEKAIEEINKQIEKYSGNWLQDMLTRNGLIIAKEILTTVPSKKVYDYDYNPDFNPISDRYRREMQEFYDL
jgi:hypothetical protein